MTPLCITLLSALLTNLYTSFFFSKTNQIELNYLQILFDIIFG